MKLNRIVRSAIAGGAALAAALGLTSCSRDFTVGYVYAVSSSANTISAFAIDYQTGILNPIAGSPFTTTVSDAIRVVASPDNQHIYVLGGPNGSSNDSQNDAVEEISVGTDGKLYGANTYSLTGSYATGIAIDSTGTFLYVTFTYQNGYTPSSPGPGGVTIFPISSQDGSLGTPTTVNVGNNPVAIAVSVPVCVPTPVIPSNGSCTGVTGGGSGNYNVYVYVVDQETNLGKPTILGFAQNTSNGSLTPLSGTTFVGPPLNTYQGVPVGVVPSAIAVDAGARWVYVTDQETNQVYGFNIARSTTGNLTPMPSSPFGTGARPVGVSLDPGANYVYTANYNSGSVSGFQISQATGSLSAVSGSTFGTHAGTSCVAIDPNLGEFLYASNYVTGNIDGANLNTHTGVLTAVANTPFPTSALPACLVAVGAGKAAQNIIAQ